MATAAAAIKATIMSEAAKPVDPVVIDSMTAATPPPPSTSTLMKESTGSLRKATVTSDGSLKEELVDRAPVLIDKAEVMQVIHTKYYILRFCHPFISGNSIFLFNSKWVSLEHISIPINMYTVNEPVKLS